MKNILLSLFFVIFLIGVIVIQVQETSAQTNTVCEDESCIEICQADPNCKVMPSLLYMSTVANHERIMIQDISISLSSNSTKIQEIKLTNLNIPLGFEFLVQPNNQATQGITYESQRLEDKIEQLDIDIADGYIKLIEAETGGNTEKIEKIKATLGNDIFSRAVAEMKIKTTDSLLDVYPQNTSPAVPTDLTPPTVPTDITISHNGVNTDAIMGDTVTITFDTEVNSTVTGTIDGKPATGIVVSNAVTLIRMLDGSETQGVPLTFSFIQTDSSGNSQVLQTAVKGTGSLTEVIADFT